MSSTGHSQSDASTIELGAWALGRRAHARADVAGAHATVLSMRPPNNRRGVLLIVGNGLTLDLCFGHGAVDLGTWNTSSPLGWPVMMPSAPDVFLRERLPEFNAAVHEFQTQTPSASDFDVIDSIAQRYFASAMAPYPVVQAYVEMRHYLALAYSTFQAAVDRVDLTSWRWVSYFRSLGRDLVAAFSFNYDLVLERALEAAGISYARVGLWEEVGGRTMIVKPHGSIDFELQDRTVAFIGREPSYPMPNLINRVNSGIKRLARDDLLRVRISPELIPPMQAATARDYQWVSPGFETFSSQGPQITGTCVLAGISYWPVDRPEIDELIDMLLPDTRIIVANPNPADDLLTALRDRGFDPIKAKSPRVLRPSWPYLGSTSTPI